MRTIQPAKIGLTMGDPAGVGPELAIRAMQEVHLRPRHALHVFGDADVIGRCADEIGVALPKSIVSLGREEYLETDCERLSDPRVVHVIDHGLVGGSEVRPGIVAALHGEASFQYIQTSIDAAISDRIDAVATGPINKTALHAAGRDQYPGHTEMFAERTQVDAGRWCMMQYSKVITCTFVTVHVGLNEVSGLITPDRVWDTICLTHEALTKLGCDRPNIVVCGLNPHAGEGGLFGNREEEQCIVPAVERAREMGMDVLGPLPPDTAFVPWMREKADAFVCMYHDQGHIPLKALAFDEAVNTTLGLKIIRTSVDHGTAYDIAWKGLARPDSLFAAIELAKQLAAC